MKLASLILSILAVLLFLVGGFFAFDSKTKLDALQKIEDQATTKIIGVREKRDNENDLRQELEAERTSVESTAGELTAQVAETKQEADELEQGNKSFESEVEAQAATVEDIKAQLNELGDIDQVVETLQQKRIELDALTSDLASSEQQIASIQARIENLDSELGRMREIQRTAASGEMVGGFNSTVRAAFPNEGFLVISGGYDRNVSSGSTMSIQRGGEQIALGEVTTVHADSSVVRLDPDSTSGSVAPGDRAVYVRPN